MNIYRYAGNNPTNVTDPNGMLIPPWMFGPIGIGAALGGWFYWDYFKGSMDDARDTGLPGAWDGPQDAYRHCVASCRVTQSFGSSLASVADWRESSDPSERSDHMDLCNNATGRELGEQLPPFDMMGSCADSCMRAVFDGSLVIINPDPDR